MFRPAVGSIRWVQGPFPLGLSNCSVKLNISFLPSAEVTKNVELYFHLRIHPHRLVLKQRYNFNLIISNASFPTW
jgi:hypothetical protein